MIRKVLKALLRSLIDDPLGLALSIFFNAMMASVFAAFPNLVLLLLLGFFEGPLEWAVGKDTAKGLIGMVDTAIYKVSFVAIFASMMLDDLGLHNVKTYVRKRWKSLRAKLVDE